MHDVSLQRHNSSLVSKSRRVVLQAELLGCPEKTGHSKVTEVRNSIPK